MLTPKGHEYCKEDSCRVVKQIRDLSEDTRRVELLVVAHFVAQGTHCDISTNVGITYLHTEKRLLVHQYIYSRSIMLERMESFVMEVVVFSD
jgi:hypothetical protein